MSKRVYGSKASERKGPRHTTGTREFQVSQDIVPIAQLKANLSELVRGLDARNRPLVITLNGAPAAVLMSPQNYDRLAYRARVVDGVEQGLADLQAGDTITDDELGKRVEHRYLKRAKRRA